MERTIRLVVGIGAVTLLAAHLAIGRAWSGTPPAAAAALVTLALLTWYDRRAIAIVLASACLLPPLVWFTLETFSAHFWIIWMAALLGAMLPDLWRSGWHAPPRWRVPLMLAGLAVTIGAPLVVLREIDFNPALLGEVPAAALSGLPWSSAAWVLLVSVTALIGVLWFDWLLGATDIDIDTFVIGPLTLSIGLSSAVAVYQMFGDVTFLNQTIYGATGRAGGTLFDGNVAGMLAAAGIGFACFLADGAAERRLWLVLVPICVAAVWASGSRSAVGAAVVILALSATGWRRRFAGARRPMNRRVVLVVTALLVAIWFGVTSLETTTVGPLRRFARMVSGSAGRSPGTAAAELWRRNGYGTASTELIGRYPLAGIGVGSFHLFGPQFTSVGALPPDNAQNWLRHQLVELGLLGGLGWVLFAVAFGTFVVTTWGRGEPRLDHVRGIVLAFAVVSLVGLPTQEVVAAVTFWTAAATLGRSREGRDARAPLGRGVLVGVLLVTTAFGVITWQFARSSLRVPVRARALGHPFSYGLYGPEPDGAGGTVRWMAERATVLADVAGPFMRITIRAPLPNVERDPVGVTVWFEGRRVIDTRVNSADPVETTVKVPVGLTQVLLDMRVTRTVRPREVDGSPDDRQLGALVGWRFTKAPE